MYNDILGDPMDEKMTEEEVKLLLEGRKYHVKLTRLYDPEPKVIWEGRCKLHIQRRSNGSMGVITPVPDDIPVSWAEYCEEDIQHDGSFVCEDYLMEIFTV